MPVGGSITRSLEPFGIHEAFQQMDRVVVERLPVGADPPRDPSQDVAGKMRHFNPNAVKK